MLVAFPALIDYSVTASDEARTGLFHFLRSYLQFVLQRPLPPSCFPRSVQGFGIGVQREGVILLEYRSLLAHWFMKSKKHNTDVGQYVLNQMLDACGIYRESLPSPGADCKPRAKSDLDQSTQSGDSEAAGKSTALLNSAESPQKRKKSDQRRLSGFSLLLRCKCCRCALELAMIVQLCPHFVTRFPSLC